MHSAPIVSWQNSWFSSESYALSATTIFTGLIFADFFTKLMKSLLSPARLFLSLVAVMSCVCVSMQALNLMCFLVFVDKPSLFL